MSYLPELRKSVGSRSDEEAVREPFRFAAGVHARGRKKGRRGIGPSDLCALSCMHCSGRQSICRLAILLCD